MVNVQDGRLMVQVVENQFFWHSWSRDFHATSVDRGRARGVAGPLKIFEVVLVYHLLYLAVVHDRRVLRYVAVLRHIVLEFGQLEKLHVDVGMRVYRRLDGRGADVVLFDDDDDVGDAVRDLHETFDGADLVALVEVEYDSILAGQ